MNCERVSSLLSAYIDREVTADEERAIRLHLADCEECTREYESLKTAKSLAGSLPSLDIPAELWPELRSRLEGEAGPSRRDSGRAPGRIPSKIFKCPPLRVLAPFGIAAGLAALFIIFPLLTLLTPPGQEQPGHQPGHGTPGQQILVDQYLREHIAWEHTRPFSNDVALTYMLTSPRVAAPEARLLSNDAPSMDANTDSYTSINRGAYEAYNDLAIQGDRWTGDLMVGP
ncbi:MAG: hypothetical protein HPY71_09920 [Firmicutes bacterium]|nr:hypothetical protein [Bacillota bacterium]